MSLLTLLSAERVRVVTITLLAFMAACTGRNTGQPRGPVRHFPLTIALSEPLGDAGTPVPDDIKGLFMPLQAKHCSGLLFVPDVRVVRLDIQASQPEDLNFPQEQNAIQRAAGQGINPEKARSIREEAIKKQQITSLMAQPMGSSTVTLENIRKLISAPINQRLFTFEATRQVMGNVLTSDKVSVASDMSDLLQKIGSTFCSRPGEKPAPQLPALVIIYKSGAVSTGFAPVASASPDHSNGTKDTTTATTAATSVSAESKEEADALFTQLAAEAQKALANPETKRAVHARLAKAQANASWDYRFTYERAKLAVYGTQKHDEAFYHLYRAAEIAIENGDADKMRTALERDSAEGEPLHKLKHGHDKREEDYQWSSILNALKTKDASLVRKLS